MKEINDLNLPENIKYTEQHEWAKKDGEIIIVGINDYAQDQLGDIVFVELPDIEDSFTQGEEFGTVESVKAVSEIYIPVSGEIIEINSELEEDPELVNTSPYDKGWIVKIKPSNLSELDNLFSKSEYLNMLKG
ncbi:MAG: glycine cleavage system protein H [Desulfobacteraceae bacterium 4572_130]|nr:MAG: glycine cleavage system protein H [Desulfobacteraceae bacterium 4572_130]